MDDSNLTTLLSMIGKLISQPENIRMLLSLLGGGEAESAPDVPQIQDLPFEDSTPQESETEMPADISVAAMPSQDDVAVMAHPTMHGGSHRQCRDMLCAITPYMNGHRTEMIDRILKVSDLVDVFRGLEHT